MSGYTDAQKILFSKDLYMAGYTKAQTAAILDIDDADIDDYWDMWEDAWIKSNEGILIRNEGVLLSAQHGAGFIGTGVAPSAHRYIRNGTIITEHHIDITGLGCKGDAQGDAIGLAAGGAAYFGQYDAAIYGICHRIEMICLETPGEGTATITDDIDLMMEDDDDVEYDGPVDDTVLAAGGSWTAGMMKIDNEPGLTDKDYFYLGEGDAGATTGVYNAGQFLIRVFGHPLFV